MSESGYAVGGQVVRDTPASPCSSQPAASPDHYTLTLEAARFRALVARVREVVARSEHPWVQLLASAGWVAVDRQDRWWMTEEPMLRGFTQCCDIWVGPAASALPARDGAVAVAGREWAQVVLPLPADDDAALSVLLHSAWCAVGQVEICGRHESVRRSTPVLARIEDPERRGYLHLEIAALRRAFGCDDAGVRQALQEALVFRKARFQRSPEEEGMRERSVALVEGMAHYVVRTALGDTLRGPIPSWFSVDERRWDSVYAHVKGPLYGMMLDRLQPGWVHHFAGATWLLGQLAEAAGPLPSMADVAQRYDLHGALQRERQATQRYDELGRVWCERAASAQTVRVRMVDLNLRFDPNAVRSLPGGTLYEVLHWRDESGAEVMAQQGAWVTHDWSEIVLWCGEGPPPSSEDVVRWIRDAGPGERFHLTGPGWSVSLPPGWVVRVQERGVVCVPLGPSVEEPAEVTAGESVWGAGREGVGAVFTWGDWYATEECGR